jgi:hypothetical protein
MGGLPRGVTAEALSSIHKSVLGDALVAEGFHRTGAVEVWGRGTSRLIEECQRYGIDAVAKPPGAATRGQDYRTTSGAICHGLVYQFRNSVRIRSAASDALSGRSLRSRYTCTG